MATAPIKPTDLRKQLFKVLDHVAATGQPVEVRRGRHVLRIVRDDPHSRLARITPLEGLIAGNPDSVLDSVQVWSEEPNL